MSTREIGYRVQYSFREVFEKARDRFLSGRADPVPEAVLAAEFLRADLPWLYAPPDERNPEDAARLLAGGLPMFGRWIFVQPDFTFWHTDLPLVAVWTRRPYGSHPCQNMP